MVDHPELCESVTYRLNKLSLPVGGVTIQPRLLELSVLVNGNS